MDAERAARPQAEPELQPGEEPLRDAPRELRRDRVRRQHQPRRAGAAPPPGQADFAAEGISPSAHADLARQYGINRRQYQVRQIPTTYYVAINTTRGIFRDANVRKAINLAIDRQAMLAQRGYLAGAADQILPPGIPGFGT